MSDRLILRFAPGRTGTLRELYLALFGQASQGFVFPVPPSAIQPTPDPLGLHQGPPATAEALATIERTGRLATTPCALAVRVPRGGRLERVLLVSRGGKPVARVAGEGAALVLEFPQAGFPFVAPGELRGEEGAAWAMAAGAACEDRQRLIERLAARGVAVEVATGRSAT